MTWFIVSGGSLDTASQTVRASVVSGGSQDTALPIVGHGVLEGLEGLEKNTGQRITRGNEHHGATNNTGQRTTRATNNMGQRTTRGNEQHGAGAGRPSAMPICQFANLPICQFIPRGERQTRRHGSHANKICAYRRAKRYPVENHARHPTPEPA